MISHTCSYKVRVKGKVRVRVRILIYAFADMLPPQVNHA